MSVALFTASGIGSGEFRTEQGAGCEGAQSHASWSLAALDLTHSCDGLEVALTSVSHRATFPRRFA